MDHKLSPGELRAESERASGPLEETTANGCLPDTGNAGTSTDEPSNPEDNDGRGLFKPLSRWESRYRKQQAREGVYLCTLLVGSLVLQALIGLEAFGSFLSADKMPVGRRFAILGLGGLLGGTVYGAKWLYHAVAKGLWHEDRRIWRFLSPIISVGTTIGIWSLMDAGFFPRIAEDSGSSAPAAPTTVLGIGFVIGYLSDRFLAKMKDLTNVLFGQTERHFPDSHPSDHP